MTTTPVLEFRNLLKQYPMRDGSGTVTVLDNINRSIHEGEFVTLVGPSGCGKTTLLKLIMGTLRPTSGEVLLNGQSVTGPGPDRGIVYQKYSLYDNRTVVENVIQSGTVTRPLFAKYLGHRSAIKADRERALAMLDRVSMADAADKYPHELSGGMRQRVAIAQTLFAKPRILLMDEPFGALDEGTRNDAQHFLLDLWEEENLTGIFITHHLPEAIYMGTRLLALSQHWEHEAGPHKTNNGARFVMDKSFVPFINRRRAPGINDEMYISKFTPLMERVKRYAMDPSMRQRTEEFHDGVPEEVLTWLDSTHMVGDEDGE